MRIGVDYTAAARQGGGIGRYTRELITALLAEPAPHDFVLLAGTAGLGTSWRQEARRLLDTAGPGQLTLRSVPLSDNWMARIWHRLRLPIPANAITGPVDLFYAPDFLLPPLFGKIQQWITIHDLSFLRHPETFPHQLREYLTAAVPRSAQRADHILTDSECTRQDVVDLLALDPECVTALPLGVSTHFGPIAHPDLETGERNHLEHQYAIGTVPYILAVGTIQPRKNYPRLIKAIDLLREQFSVELVIAGQPAWMAEETLSAARKRNYVRLLGFVKDEDLPTLYRQADVFVFPSLYEGFGLPPLEAMACGTPVVASSSSSIPEAVGDAGVLVDPLDVTALAEALQQVLTDTALRSQLRERGLRRAATFSWRRTAQAWLAQLRDSA